VPDTVDLKRELHGILPDEVRALLVDRTIKWIESEREAIACDRPPSLPRDMTAPHPLSAFFAAF